MTLWLEATRRWVRSLGSWGEGKPGSRYQLALVPWVEGRTGAEEDWAGCLAALRHCQLRQPVARIPLQPGSCVRSLSKAVALELVWEPQVNFPGSYPVKRSIMSLLYSVVIFVLLQCKCSIYSIFLKVVCLRTRKHQTRLQNLIKYISYRIGMC